MMNNKGMTLVEIIITFALVMAIVVGLYNLIIEVKFQMDERSVAKDINAYTSTVNHSIHFNMIKKQPKVLFLKESRQSKWTKITPNLEDENAESEEILTGAATVGNRSFGDVSNLDKNYCHYIYPCLIYVSQDEYTVGVIALFNREAVGLKEGLLGQDYGILYGLKTIEAGTGNISTGSSNVIFDPLPDSNKVDPLKFTSTPSNKESQTYIKYYSDDKTIEINYPLYIVDNPKNYGFRIAYSFIR